MTDAIERFLSERRRPTPCLVIDLARVSRAYREVGTAFPTAAVHYAVKANPAVPVVRHLERLGASFDVASRQEIQTCLRLGVDPARLSYGNTAKKEIDIAWAYRHGVRQFVFDSGEELRKLASRAPGASVTCRLLVNNVGARWPLARKFGCQPSMAEALMLQAPGLGLVAGGISFHVGSQQTSPSRWKDAIHLATGVFHRLRSRGLRPSVLNLGGGFPVPYEDEVPPLSSFARAIKQALFDGFGADHPALVLEPGRFLLAEAGIIESEVVLVARKSGDDPVRWVYLDIGRFGGLAEVEGGAIRYSIETPGVGGPSGPVILAGPTCDGADVLYDKADVRMPLALTSGHRVRIRSAGAYTSVYASRFNDIPKIRTHCIEVPVTRNPETYTDSSMAAIQEGRA